MGTTVGAAYTALHAMLTARAAGGEPLEGVQIAYGPPVFYEGNEVIALLGFSAVETEHVSLGFDIARHREAYAITARIKVYRPGAGYSDVPALHLRALELYGVLTDVVQDDPTLQGALTDGWAIVAAEEGEDSGPFPAIDDEAAEGGVGGYTGWVEFIGAVIRCEARVG